MVSADSFETLLLIHQITRRLTPKDVTLNDMTCATQILGVSLRCHPVWKHYQANPIQKTVNSSKLS